MLARKDMKLDAAIELQVDSSKLVDRIMRRAEEAKAAGHPVRKDDDPEVFKTRLAAYQKDTAAVTPYYRAGGVLHCVDGMAPIGEVSASIDGILAAHALRRERCRPRRRRFALAANGSDPPLRGEAMSEPEVLVEKRGCGGLPDPQPTQSPQCAQSRHGARHRRGAGRLGARSRGHARGRHRRGRARLLRGRRYPPAL